MHAIIAYLRSMFFVLTPGFVGLIGLRAFTSLPTAILYAGILSTFVFFGARYYYKHHSAGMFDDKLTGERQRAAQGWIIQRFQDESETATEN